MASRSTAAFAAILPFLATATGAGAQNSEIPFRLQNHFVVVQGSIGNVTRLRFAIDTGTTRSLIDAGLVKRLELRPEPQEFSLRAFGEKTISRKVHIRGLCIGPFKTSIDCFEAKVSDLIKNVDGVIGLDLMCGAGVNLIDGIDQERKEHSLSINYESGKIQFGQTAAFGDRTSFDIGESGILVRVVVDNQPVLLKLDTGAQITTLYRGAQKGWLDCLPRRGIASGICVAGSSLIQRVLLPKVSLGTSRWAELPGCILDASNQSADGVLAIAPLDLKALHIDFDRKIASWRK